MKYKNKFLEISHHPEAKAVIVKMLRSRSSLAMSEDEARELLKALDQIFGRDAPPAASTTEGEPSGQEKRR